MEGDIILFAFIVLLALIFFLDHQKKMMMLAKGMNPDKMPKPERHTHLLAGLIFSFIGVAFLISMFALNAPGFILIGTVLVAIGLGILIDYKIHKK